MFPSSQTGAYDFGNGAHLFYDTQTADGLFSPVGAAFGHAAFVPPQLNLLPPPQSVAPTPQPQPQPPPQTQSQPTQPPAGAGFRQQPNQTGAVANLAPATQSTAAAAVNLAPGAPVLPLDQGHFLSPRRPDYGKEGELILLRANHFQVRIPGGMLHHYEALIQPDKCPRRVNRYDIR